MTLYSKSLPSLYSYIYPMRITAIQLTNIRDQYFSHDAHQIINLTNLRIANNQFGGNIPAAAAGLQEFTAVNNSFSGEMPANLGNGMPLLQTMDLSGNQLSGGIP